MMVSDLGRWTKRVVIAGIVAISSFIFGLLLFNYFIMPRVVGLGEEVEVPNVVGLSRSQATATLEEEGLSGIVEGERFDSNVPEGFVAAQDPLPATLVKKGRTVALILSRGPEMVEVPHLDGVELRLAKTVLVRAGLSVGRVDSVASGEVPVGHVVSSDPAGGEILPRGSSILLRVRFEEEFLFEMPELIGVTLAQAQVVILEQKLVLGDVRYVFRPSEPEGIVLMQVPQAGSRVSEGDTVELAVASRGGL
jgi:beta-lactam-binding protein with PASTA domain